MGASRATSESRVMVTNPATASRFATKRRRAMLHGVLKPWAGGPISTGMPGMSISARSASSSAIEGYPWVHHRVQNIGQQVARDHEHRGDHAGSHNHRVVASANRIDCERAHAGPGENLLDYGCSADQERQR